MKAPQIFIAVLATIATAAAQQDQPQDERPLVRVQGTTPAPEPEAQGGATKEFDAAAFAERLADPDLDAREKSFGNLVRRAQVDAAARAFLEETARDAARPELAWTARLALRELGRRATPFGRLPEAVEMEESMRRLFEALGEAPIPDGAIPFEPRELRILPLVPSQLDASTGRSVQLQQGPAGAKLVITETVEGRESTREFEGRDLQEILEKNPELGQEIHLSVDGGNDAFRLRWSQDPSRPPSRDPFSAPSRKSQALRTDVLGVVAAAISPARAQELGVPSGLLVRSVARGTIASLLQVREGDILLEVNGRPLARAQDITEALAARPAEGTLSVEWIDQMGQRIEKTWRPDGAK